jgi:hypothetical protein
MFAWFQVCEQSRNLVCSCAIRLEFSSRPAIDHAVLERNSLMNDDRADLAALLANCLFGLGCHL